MKLSEVLDPNQRKMEKVVHEFQSEKSNDLEVYCMKVEGKAYLRFIGCIHEFKWSKVLELHAQIHVFLS